jgi:hypothetical protein
LCHQDMDDLHHLLVECEYPQIKSLRRSYLSKSLQTLRSSSYVPPLVSEYARTLSRLLSIPDPSRLSHAIWLGRPFLSTLKAADDLMPRAQYQGALISQLAYHLPFFLLTLFEGVIDLWKTRCKLIHPPDPLPLVRIPKATLNQLRKRRRVHKHSLPRPSSQFSLLSQTAPTAETPDAYSASTEPSLFSNDSMFIASLDDSVSSPVLVDSLAHTHISCTHTYIPVLLSCQSSSHTHMRTTDLEADAARPPPGADTAPSPSIK